MIYLPESVKKILNALAVQDAGEYLTDGQKQAALKKVLSDIEAEKQTTEVSSHTISSSNQDTSSLIRA